MQLIGWLDAQAKHEADTMLGNARRDRIHGYKLVSAFVGDEMPTLGEWWPLPGDEEYLKGTSQQPAKVSAKEFVSGIGAAFRNR